MQGVQAEVTAEEEEEKEQKVEEEEEVELVRALEKQEKDGLCLLQDSEKAASWWTSASTSATAPWPGIWRASSRGVPRRGCPRWCSRALPSGAPGSPRRWLPSIPPPQCRCGTPRECIPTTPNRGPSMRTPAKS